MRHGVVVRSCAKDGKRRRREHLMCQRSSRLLENPHSLTHLDELSYYTGLLLLNQCFITSFLCSVSSSFSSRDTSTHRQIDTRARKARWLQHSADQLEIRLLKQTAQKQKGTERPESQLLKPFFSSSPFSNQDRGRGVVVVVGQARKTKSERGGN